MMTVPVRILTVRNSVSTETVRKQYGNSTETLRNSVSTPYCVVHGYPRKARESDFCMYGGRRDQQGCVTVMQGCVTANVGHTGTKRVQVQRLIHFMTNGKW